MNLDGRGRSPIADGEVEAFEAVPDLVGMDGLWSGQLIYTAIEHQIFDYLIDGPASASRIAGDLGLHVENTYRLLRALGHYGVLREQDNRQFSMTSVGHLFTSESPHPVREAVRLFRSPEWIAAMLHLPDIVEDGNRDGFEREFDRDLFEYIRDHPEFGDRFDSFMTVASRGHTKRALELLDSEEISRLSTICDVGGGRGYLLCHFLKHYSHLNGKVLDLPTVLADEDELLAKKMDVADRCQYIEGDMFDTVPTADGYFLKNVLHNWDDERCVTILSNIHANSPADARLFVFEGIVPSPDMPHEIKQLDMSMLVHMGGKERTIDEFESLFERADWELVGTKGDPDAPIQIIEARKQS